VLPLTHGSPGGPAGPDTATGVLGTLTTVGLSQAVRLRAANSADINIERFIRNPLISNSGIDNVI